MALSLFAAALLARLATARGHDSNAIAMGVPPPAHLVGWRRLGGRSRIGMRSIARRSPLQPHRANYPVPAPRCPMRRLRFSRSRRRHAPTRRAASDGPRTLERVGGHAAAVPSHLNRPAYTSTNMGPTKIAMWPIEARRNRIHAIRLCHVPWRSVTRRSASPHLTLCFLCPSRFPRGICWTSLRSPSACALSSRPQCVSLDGALPRF